MTARKNSNKISNQAKKKFVSVMYWCFLFHQKQTSKKIPHLTDVVCHAVQTET